MQPNFMQLRHAARRDDAKEMMRRDDAIRDEADATRTSQLLAP
jgi:hypothetical protein